MKGFRLLWRFFYMLSREQMDAERSQNRKEFFDRQKARKAYLFYITLAKRLADDNYKKLAEEQLEIINGDK